MKRLGNCCSPVFIREEAPGIGRQDPSSEEHQHTISRQADKLAAQLPVAVAGAAGLHLDLDPGCADRGVERADTQDGADVHRLFELEAEAAHRAVEDPPDAELLLGLLVGDSDLDRIAPPAQRLPLVAEAAVDEWVGTLTGRTRWRRGFEATGPRPTQEYVEDGKDQ